MPRTAEQQKARDFQNETGWPYTECLRIVRSGVTELVTCPTCRGSRNNGGRAHGIFNPIDFCLTCYGAGHMAPDEL